MEENNQSNDNLDPKTKDEQTNKDNNQISNVQETKASDFKISSQEPIKKKGNKTILIVIILLIFAIVAGLIYYFGYYTKPDQIYKRLIETNINSYTNKLNKSNYKTIKTAIKIDTDINTDSEEIDEKILDLINNIDISLDMQTDIENKKIIANLESDYDKEDLLNVKMYSDIENQKTYIYLKDLLNKYIEAEMDEELYTSFNELLNNQQMTQDKKISLQKAMKILKNELTNVIKEEYCFSKKEDITVNNETLRTTKNTIKMTKTQLKDEFITLFTNLKDNEEFLDCFEEKDEIYNSLQNLIKEFDDLEDDDNSTIELNIYTKGLMQQLAKADIIVYSEENDQTVTMAVTNLENDIYSFEILSGNDIIKGTLNIDSKNENEGIVKLSLEIQEFGKIDFNIDYSQKFNEQIDVVNVKNSVKPDELTSADQKSLITNLEKSKLYELIQDLTKPLYNQKNDINDIIEDDEEEIYETKENEIISYNDKYKITFNIPSGYISKHVSDNYKSLNKDDVSIKISTKHSNKDEYYESLEKNVEYYKQEEKYKNVNLSHMESIEVNNRTFYYATFSYEYESGSQYSVKYFWSEIEEDYVLDIQIINPNDITSEELNYVLELNVEEN